MTATRPALRKSGEGSKIFESYCGLCGLFIAASSGTRFLEMAEKLHRCPQAGRVGNSENLCSPEAHVVSYLLGLPSMRPDPPVEDKLDRLLRELSKREPALYDWLDISEKNALWFRDDPIAAIKAANLGIDDSLFEELDAITRAIAQKLRITM